MKYFRGRKSFFWWKQKLCISDIICSHWHKNAAWMCIACNFCPCFCDSWSKIRCWWWWQWEKHLLCCLELTAEQNRTQFMTIYFLLSSGIMWFFLFGFWGNTRTAFGISTSHSVSVGCYSGLPPRGLVSQSPI